MTIEYLSDPHHAELLSAALARNNDAAARLVAERGEIKENLKRLAEKLGDPNGHFPWVAFEAATGPLERRLGQVKAELDELADVSSEDVQAEDRARLEVEWDAGTLAERRTMLTKALRRGVKIVIRPAIEGPMIRDVAAHLGIHRDTAGRALSGSDRVSEAIREQVFAATKDLAYGGRAVTLRHSMALHPLARTDRSVPTKGLGDAVLALAAVIAGVVFAGPLFVRWQTRKDGVRQRYWRNAGSWEIVGLAVFLALALMAMGQN